ncbi:helix-turn-helix domain-containing protein [Polaribacter ponticola]|uniref:AraC family transcriptional regulator n=1 Tax=Polaribacter ponticola TaxID=2978475 RepID=A0ABT5SD31_9FLAO|nr:AraC family transcriptional regulator [Polaribacter sp. MSW5]MDD7916048.1 AraC family transcriptional regulator [Polaribacter sp. MSW5]
MTRNESYKPTKFLSKYIDRFYIFEKSSADYFELPSVLPGTGLELVFYLDKPLSINKKILPKSHTVCPRNILNFDKEKNVSLLSVRFKSGAFRHFTSVPFSELNDNYFSVQNLWKSKGNNLLNKLENISGIQNKVKVIESFLISNFKEYHKDEDDKWDLVLDELYYNFDSNTIDLISQKANLSLRQFERSFKSQFGITAKEFQKITRFQDVIKKILLNRKSDYLDTILDNGYFDQSHFIKEFKSLTKKTPLEYFTKENFDSHFYHKSLNKKPVANNV